MMKAHDKPAKRNWLPYVVAPVVFLLASILYFAPQLEGKKLQMHDVTQYVGSSKDIEDHVEKYGEDPQWTGNSFSGMPSYMIDFKVPAWIIRHASKIPLRALGEPAILIFMAMLCFWLMTLMWKIDPWVGIIPALAYGFSTYTILIIGAGHISKVWAMAYAPLLMGTIVYTYRGGHMWLGAALAALAASLEISANHPQITYYFLLVIAALVINEAVCAARRGTLRRFWKATGALAIAAAFAVGSNFAPLYYTAQHAADTTRGGSELTAEGATASDGLDLEYATAWSYGRSESLNMLVPNLKGGSSSGQFPSGGKYAEALSQYGLRTSDLPLGTYWGDQPGTAGPTYIGAVVVFLALLGMFVLKGPQKWWLAVVSLLALFLAWGSNMMWFTELCFKVLPGYNKFRAVSTALVIVQWTLPVLAAMTLMELWRGSIPGPNLRRGIAWSAGLAGGTALLLAIAGGRLFGFESPGEYAALHDMAVQAGLGDREAGYFAGTLIEGMRADRAAMLRTDSWRTLLFVLVSAGTILLLQRGRLKRGAFAAVFAALVVFDLATVDARYLGYKDFVPERRTQIYPTEADKEILADTEPGFRVANMSLNTFSDATTSYFHRSVGGYHGAKLRRYQDLIDRHLSTMNTEVYDMLNTKYFIIPDRTTGRLTAMQNPDANGAAWFVEEVRIADSPDEEIDALCDTDTRRTAVVARADAERLAVRGTADTTARISLTDYRANRLVYEYESATDALAVFSEIYYDKGWKAYVDGVETPHLRADYVLRAMELPAGRHTVEFRFRAPHFRAASAVTLVCSLVILLAVAATAAYTLLRRNNRTAAEEKCEE